MSTLQQRRLAELHKQIERNSILRDVTLEKLWRLLGKIKEQTKQAERLAKRMARVVPLPVAADDFQEEQQMPAEAFEQLVEPEISVIEEDWLFRHFYNVLKRPMTRHGPIWSSRNSARPTRPRRGSIS